MRHKQPMMQKSADAEISSLSPSTAVYPKGKQRVQDILDTATEVLAFDGYSAFTMRNISSKMSISLRNLQYYFQTKSDLFQAVVERMINRELDTARAAIEEQPGLTDRERFRNFIDYSIRDNETPLIRGFQFELWAMATRDRFAEKCRDKMTSAYLDFIYDLVKPLTPGLTTEQQRNKSAIILAILQGSPLINGQGVTRKYKKNIRQRIHDEIMSILLRE